MPDVRPPSNFLDTAPPTWSRWHANNDRVGLRCLGQNRSQRLGSPSPSCPRKLPKTSLSVGTSQKSNNRPRCRSLAPSRCFGAIDLVQFPHHRLWTCRYVNLCCCSYPYGLNQRWHFVLCQCRKVNHPNFPCAVVRVWPLRSGGGNLLGWWRAMPRTEQSRGGGSLPFAQR